MSIRLIRSVFGSLAFVGVTLGFQNCTKSFDLLEASQPQTGISMQPASDGTSSTSRQPASDGTSSKTSLASLQPPLEITSEDRLGLDINCDFWKMDQNALDDCTKDLDLIRDLGIGSVRIGSSWYSLTKETGDMDPQKVAFLKALLNEARKRGMKILFLVGLEAPASAYRCSETLNPPSSPSVRLDFCLAAFEKYFSELMDLVLPFTAHIELFNETNWNYPADIPTYNDPYGVKDQILSRSKALYISAKKILNGKKTLGFSAVLHSQGISYFYNSDFPDKGWNSGSLPLILAKDYVYWMEYGWQGDENILNQVIDVVDFHPYFNSADYNVLVQDFALAVSKLVPGGYKYLWITETNSGTIGSEEEQIKVFKQLVWFLENNWIQKAFWFVVRNGYENGEGDRYGLYDINRNLIKPNLAAEIRKQASKIPLNKRFLPETYRKPIE